MRLLTADGWQQTRDRSAGWYDNHFTFNGQPHELTQSSNLPVQTLPGSKAEQVGSSLSSRVAQIHEQNGPVAAAVTARALALSDLRFAWRPSFGGTKLFGTQELGVLEHPSPSMTRARWLYRLEMDVSYAGNSYTVRRANNTLARLRPDWVVILVGSNGDGEPDDVIGYAYFPNGDRTARPVIYTPSEVMHWAPEPLPDREYLGGSWVTGVLREVMADGQAIDHISKFFANSATANMVVKAPDGMTLEQFTPWVDAFEDAHAGSRNAYKTVYMSPGTDVTVVGSSMAELDLRNVVGGFENRVSMRSRVPAIVMLIREGMSGSALNAGNYNSTRRLWVDAWFSPYAAGFCASAETLLEAPRNAELTFDQGRILLMQEDQLDAAEIRAKDATTLDALYRSGFEADAAVEALTTGDFSVLAGRHTGLASVQASTEVAPNVA